MSHEADLRELLADDLTLWAGFATGLRSLRPATGFVLAHWSVELLGVYVDENRGTAEVVVAMAADRLNASADTVLWSVSERLRIWPNGNEATHSQIANLLTLEGRNVGLGLIFLHTAGAVRAADFILRVFEDESRTRKLTDLRLSPDVNVERAEFFEL